MREFDKMVEFLDLSYMLKDQLVPCLVGPVGIGKTEAVMQHAKNVKANKVVQIIASQILPNEVSGITMPDPESKSMEIYDHFRLSSLEDGDILFFDELLEADQMVLSACLTLIESRQMMSGKKLPDIQIIAATNPTIQPSMLKESIRQRFIFKKFEVDKKGCKDFIMNDCGVDVSDLVDHLRTTGGDYNILSQRSLTKMARWIAKADEVGKDNEVALLINTIWGVTYGDQLRAGLKSKSPETQTRIALEKVLSKHLINNHRLSIDDMKIIDSLRDNIDDMSFTEIILELQKTSVWEKIKEELENHELVDDRNSVAF